MSKNIKNNDFNALQHSNCLKENIRIKHIVEIAALRYPRYGIKKKNCSLEISLKKNTFFVTVFFWSVVINPIRTGGGCGLPYEIFFSSSLVYTLTQHVWDTQCKITFDFFLISKKSFNKHYLK